MFWSLQSHSESLLLRCFGNVVSSLQHLRRSESFPENIPTKNALRWDNGSQPVNSRSIIHAVNNCNTSRVHPGVYSTFASIPFIESNHTYLHSITFHFQTTEWPPPADQWAAAYTVLRCHTKRWPCGLQSRSWFCSLGAMLIDFGPKRMLCFLGKTVVICWKKAGWIKNQKKLKEKCATPCNTHDWDARALSETKKMENRLSNYLMTLVFRWFKIAKNIWAEAAMEWVHAIYLLAFIASNEIGSPLWGSPPRPSRRHGAFKVPTHMCQHRPHFTLKPQHFEALLAVFTHGTAKHGYWSKPLPYPAEQPILAFEKD